MGRTTFYLLEEEKKKQKKAEVKSGIKIFTPNYSGMTKDDLYKLAQDRNIEGRTKLDKDGLIKALKEADS